MQIEEVTIHNDARTEVKENWPEQTWRYGHPTLTEHKKTSFLHLTVFYFILEHGPASILFSDVFSYFLCQGQVYRKPVAVKD